MAYFSPLPRYLEKLRKSEPPVACRPRHAARGPRRTGRRRSSGAGEARGAAPGPTVAGAGSLRGSRQGRAAAPGASARRTQEGRTWQAGAASRRVAQYGPTAVHGAGRQLPRLAGQRHPHAAQGSQPSVGGRPLHRPANAAAPAGRRCWLGHAQLVASPAKRGKQAACTATAREHREPVFLFHSHLLIS